MHVGQSEGLSGEKAIVLTKNEGVVTLFLIGFSLVCFGTYLEIRIDFNVSNGHVLPRLRYSGAFCKNKQDFYFC